MLRLIRRVLSLLEQINHNAGAYSILIGALLFALVGWLVAVQLQTLRTLQRWEAEHRAIEQQRLVMEQENSAREAAQMAERLAREQAVHQSRQSVVEATALLQQLKRQFG